MKLKNKNKENFLEYWKISSTLRIFVQKQMEYLIGMIQQDHIHRIILSRWSLIAQAKILKKPQISYHHHQQFLIQKRALRLIEGLS